VVTFDDADGSARPRDLCRTRKTNHAATDNYDIGVGHA
jgi:hypothetical protein